jgi:hypothetical protein
MQKYMDDENVIPKEQKGAAAEQKNAKIICYFQKQYYKNVNAMAWIDYQKAFDRVPHMSSWIIKSLELIRINNKVIAFT